MASELRALLLLAVLAAALAAGPAAPAAAQDDNPGDPPGTPADLALDFYQGYLSSLRHARCRFEPSCSAYARDAIARYGLFSGSARAADRLMRCNSSAGRFHRGNPRLPGGLADPAEGERLTRTEPHVPAWLLPAFPLDPPPLADAGLAARTAETVAFARSLASNGDCWRAETEYLRAAHLAATAGWRLWAHQQSGACWLEAGYWGEAERSYLSARLLATDPAEERLAAHLLAVSLFDAGRFRAAAEQLDGPDLAPRALALRGLCATARGRWDDARRDLAAGARSTHDATLAARLSHMEQLAATGPDLPGRSPGFAMVASAVIPGSGQIYAGRIHDGLRHLIFNGILVYTFVKLLEDEHYPAAYGVAMVGVPFYVGNVRGAGWSARAYNRERRLELTARMFRDAGEAGRLGE